MNDFIFEIVNVSFLILSKFNAIVAACWKHLSSSFLGFIVAFFFFTQSRESIYKPPCLKLLTQSKIKLLPLILVFKPICYLERSKSKRLFNNFIQIMISYNFSITTFWMHCLFFIGIFGRNKVNFEC